jgi:hypothetical protein
MNTSANGGLTWSAPVAPAGGPDGLGGQPVVQPNGTVIVPADNAFQSAIIAFHSTDGGQTWSAGTTVTTVSEHTVAGNLRTSPLPSAEIDGAGNVYVVWQDCRFETNCTANDIVMSTSSDGVTWSPIARIPIDAVGSGVDHFIPGIAVDRGTSGASAHLALTYYYYPVAACSSSTCRLQAGYISSANGGATWSAPTELVGPGSPATGLPAMSLSWLPSTTQGVMVGDYISTSITSDGNVTPVFAVAQPPSGTVLNQGMYSVHLGAPGGAVAAADTSPLTGLDQSFNTIDHSAKGKVEAKHD